jgi:adenosylcobinamide-phosphate synthase
MQWFFVPAGILVCAWVLDALLGDPEWLPHPVRWIGRLIGRGEVWCRTMDISLRRAGICLCLGVVGLVFVCAAGAIALASYLAAPVGAALSVILIYLCLATRCLAKEAAGVHACLQSGDLAAARARLSRIVGRDTADMQPADIIRATVETVAENTVDGVLAPLLYAFIGGAPLALAYKAVNTLDSMVGYKNERYRDLGWFSARFDDMVNWVPARMSVLCIALAVLILRPRRLGRMLTTAVRDGRKSPSPNAGYPEAAFAGALGVRLGGPATYGGVTTIKPDIGDRERGAAAGDIPAALRLLWGASVAGLALCAGASAALSAVVPALCRF